MSDDTDIITGGSEPVAQPSEHPRVVEIADERSRDQHVRDEFNKGLTLTAFGTEDATDYIKERETQDQFLEGKDLSPGQYKEWHQRTHEALRRASDAVARARGEVPPSQQSMSEETTIPGVYISPGDPDFDAHVEFNTRRFSEYFDRPENIGNQNTWQEHKKAVADWVTTFDPKGTLTGYFMASPLGPQMMEALEGEGDAIKYLASLPPAARAKEMGKLEGYVHAQLVNGQQQQNYAPQEPQPRRASQAPPPIRPVRGGATPPKDLHSLAMRDDVKDYVEQRRKQEYQARREQDLDSWQRR